MNFTSLLRAAAPLLALALLAASPLAPTLASGARAAVAEIAPPAAIMLKTRALIEGDVVRLGDLFEGLGEKAGTPVARSPSPGHEVELGARWLAALARKYDLPWRPDSRFERVMVERNSRVIAAELIHEELMHQLGAEMPDADFDMTLDNPSMEIVLSSATEASLGIRNLVYNRSSGRFQAQIVVPAVGKVIAQSSVTGRVTEMIEVPVLARSIGPGEEISVHDVDWLRIRAGRSHRGVARDFESVVGKSPRRPMTIGRPIRLSDLREPVVVAKNSLVSIVLKTPSMSLTVQGRALEDGAGGSVIRVMNTMSNAVINAVVVSAGEVMVVPATATRSAAAPLAATAFAATQ